MVKKNYAAISHGGSFYCIGFNSITCIHMALSINMLIFMSKLLLTLSYSITKCFQKVHICFKNAPQWLYLLSKCFWNPTNMIICAVKVISKCLYFICFRNIGAPFKKRMQARDVKHLTTHEKTASCQTFARGRPNFVSDTQNVDLAKLL